MPNRNNEPAAPSPGRESREVYPAAKQGGVRTCPCGRGYVSRFHCRLPFYCRRAAAAVSPYPSLLPPHPPVGGGAAGKAGSMDGMGEQQEAFEETRAGRSVGYSAARLAGGRLRPPSPFLVQACVSAGLLLPTTSARASAPGRRARGHADVRRRTRLRVGPSSNSRTSFGQTRFRPKGARSEMAGASVASPVDTPTWSVDTLCTPCPGVRVDTTPISFSYTPHHTNFRQMKPPRQPGQPDNTDLPE